ncbi:MULTISPECIES: ATP synthase F1 subunit epsilon [unclassified Bacteroides]|uniref:ATP synthase F1 subunit epsilon n=1 Tax=unclassified Bacteroides TaxID=2646097 RepID=UPI00159634B3|nr:MULTISPECIES: ATP synthase F1 subunit epsilon [unclassified Bacteroides]NVK93381.1 ATP synthase F1 subunit epsilon [Bacteroides sp. L10-4]
MKGLQLNIVSPEEELFDGEVDYVTLPGEIGSFTILPRHAPIISALRAGTLSYVTKDGEEHSREINGGFIEMNGNNVSVCIE